MRALFAAVRQVAIVTSSLERFAAGSCASGKLDYTRNNWARAAILLYNVVV